ncbi:MAG: hypothetical protein OXR73_00185 [Myxococcales bacterium]|nr:hypothetical protein [Myxococcales bacterium]
MSDDLQLPLPLADLPKALQRFCNPEGPTPGRMMAAKGLVPVKGTDQIIMLAQLSADADEMVAKTARDSLDKLPEAVMAGACDAQLPAAVLDLLASVVSDDELLGTLVANNATSDTTVERVARTASERLSERIAVNEARLLAAPGIIEALYKNRQTRMSTADRLIELAARNGLELTGIPAFKAHVEALQGQLIPEPSDDPLPQDAAFNDALEADDDDDAYERDKVSGMEEVKQKFKPLKMQIMEMTKAEKLRLALVGNAGARAILVRDNNKQVAMASVTSPQMTLPEACDLAKSKEVSEEVLRYVGSRKEWIKSAEIKHNLVFNPKTPVGISLRFMSHLRLDELKTLARNRNVSGQLRSLAAQHVTRKEKR